MPACCFLCSRLKEPETDFSQVVFPLHCMCAGPLFSRLAKTWPKAKRRAKRAPQGTATTSPVGKASGSRSFLDGGSFLGFVVAVLGVSNVVKTFKYFRGKGLLAKLAKIRTNEPMKEWTLEIRCTAYYVLQP